MLDWLKKKILTPTKYGTVTITPFVIWRTLDLPQEKQKICNTIASHLDCYLDRIAALHRASVPIFGTVRLCEIRADWDIDNNHISVTGWGHKRFTWSGKLEDFLSTSKELLTDTPNPPDDSCTASAAADSPVE